MRSSPSHDRTGRALNLCNSNSICTVLYDLKLKYVCSVNQIWVHKLKIAKYQTITFIFVRIYEKKIYTYGSENSDEFT